MLTPDTLHQRTGDTELLRRQWHSGLAWIDEAKATAIETLMRERHLVWVEGCWWLN